MKPTTRLRRLLSEGLVVAPGCYDAMSARLAELAGFDAVHLTGLGVEATQLGAPDLGLLSMTELATHAARVAAAVQVPVMADIDTGFGGVLNVNRTIREMERAGVAGVHIEDQKLPKHCPLLAGRAVVAVEEAVERITAACQARTDPDFVIVARTDADVISVREVIDRSNRYLQAGADMAMPVTMQVDGTPYASLSPNEQMDLLRLLAKEIDGPVMGMGSAPPDGFTTADLAEAGFSFMMFAASPLAAAANAMAGLFRDIRKTGSDSGYFAANPGIYSDPLEIMRAVHLEAYAAVETNASR
ncbi:isocitrate lyase/PEP mutase family protein [Streptomyces sp. NPDC093970]|uniref:isocitrate lyase/PEP mutase family protein n=1 Tax=Streptomyces sp. NPDC093970 TaxID=3155076 RepID=UPI003446319B